MNIEDIANTVKTAKELGVPVEDLSKNALDKPTKELGDGIADIFWLIFAPFKAARASLEPRINQYKKNLEERLSKIPPENLIEPPLNIVGPALEAAKYYIEDESISEMFTKLISSSMDCRTQDRTHPSFVEIIKQLSTFDAQNLKFLFENIEQFGIININLISKHPVSKVRGNTTAANNILPFPDLDFPNQGLYLTSIDNLERLKIIYISYDNFHLEESKYKIFESHRFYHFVRTTMSNATLSDGSEIVAIEDQRGIWGFTSFGRNFAKCCLE